MSRSNHPLYQKGVKAYLVGDSTDFSRIREKTELSLTERRLLEARAFFRESKLKEALSLLESITPPDSIFLQAELLFLSATAHNQQGFFEKAITLNQEAFELYGKIEDSRGLFLTSYNLSVDYGRLNLLELSKYWITKAERFAFAVDEKVLIQRAWACQAGKEDRNDDARRSINKALQHREELNDVDQNTLDTVAADILFRCGDWAEARECLQRLHRKRSNREHPRVEFERLLIEALIDKKKLSVAGQIVTESPEHLLKWNLLKAIQDGENAKAHSLWSALQQGNPNVFGAPFALKNKSDLQSVFGVYLSKHVVKKAISSTPRMLVRMDGKGRLSKLFETLHKSQTPLRKEELIEKVWGTSYAPSLDSRLYKLIQRLRDEKGIKVISENRAYRLLQ